MNATDWVLVLSAAALAGLPWSLLLLNRLVPGLLADREPRDVKSWLPELRCTCTVPPSTPTAAAITCPDCPVHGPELAAIRTKGTNVEG